MQVSNPNINALTRALLNSLALMLKFIDCFLNNKIPIIINSIDENILTYAMYEYNADVKNAVKIITNRKMLIKPHTNEMSSIFLFVFKQNVTNNGKAYYHSLSQV